MVGLDFSFLFMKGLVDICSREWNIMGGKTYLIYHKTNLHYLFYTLKRWFIFLDILLWHSCFPMERTNKLLFLKKSQLKQYSDPDNLGVMEFCKEVYISSCLSPGHYGFLNELYRNCDYKIFRDKFKESV